MDVENQELLNKVTNIEKKVKEIYQLQNKVNEPIFIELLGTPKSGKTTLKKYLTALFEKNNIQYLTRRETAEYNPIEKTENGYNLWMILELLKNVDEDLSKNEGKIIIYDRGLLDRIPWMEYDILDKKISREDMNSILRMYKIGTIKDYKPIAKIFITSPEISIVRKGKPGQFVNINSINTYNNLLKDSLKIIESKSLYSDITSTDEYQGNIEKFVIDSSNSIINEISKELKERSNKHPNLGQIEITRYQRNINNKVIIREED